MAKPHGKALRTGEAGKGIHGYLGRSDVTDEAALIALLQDADDVARVVRQTGGIFPGDFVLEGVTGDYKAMGPSDDKVLDPPQITATQVAYNPTGWNKKPTKVRLDLDAARIIQGIVAARGGRTIINASNFILTIEHLAGAAAAADRIFVPGGVNLDIAPGESVTLWYDYTAGVTVWRVFSTTPVVGFQIDTYTNIDNDTTDAGALTLAFGTCYICDNAGVLNSNNLNLELPTQTADDKGKGIWVRARYSIDPHDWGAGDRPPVAAIKPTGGDSILQAGATTTDVLMAVNDDNVKFEPVGNGDWILT